MDITLHRIEEELKPIRIKLYLYDDETGQKTSGDTAINFLTTSDIYVQFFDAQNPDAPVLSKHMSNGAAEDGLSIEETLDDSYLIIDFLAADFTGEYNCGTKTKRTFLVHIMYVYNTDDVQYIFPHDDEERTRVNLYIEMRKKLIVE